MNETMFQEAMLDRVDAIDDVVLESQIQTLLSVYDVYTKEMMVQEATIMESDNAQPADPAKKESWIKKIIRVIKGLIDRFIDSIRSMHNKIRRKRAMKNLGINEKKGTIKIDCDFDVVISVLKDIDYFFSYLTAGEKGSGKRGMTLSKELRAAVAKKTSISIMDFEKKSDEIQKLLTSCKTHLKELDERLGDIMKEWDPEIIKSINQIEEAIGITITAVGKVNQKVDAQLNMAEAVDAKYDAA